MAEPLRVLLVEDSADDALLVLRELRRAGYEVAAERIETAAALELALGREWDIVIADYSLPGFDALEALRLVRASGQDVPFIIVSGTIGEETAVAAMRAGAHDYLMKNNLARLAPAVERELREAGARRERRAMEELARRSDRLAGLGTLAAGLAHELNNPIGIISSRIELMLMEAGDQVPPAFREDLEVLHRHTARVARIAHGLLSLARQSSGERRPVDLNAVVQEVMLLIGKQLGRQGIDLRLDLGEVPPILGDADALAQIVLNLVTNARDAMSGGGTIAVATRPAVTGNEPGVELTIADTGPGIAAEHLPRVFDPFFTTKPAGTGLGLAITAGIVRDHGATIEVRSAPGEGTTFTLTFSAPRAGGWGGPVADERPGFAGA
jgi:signal transduction histidine kinase